MARGDRQGYAGPVARSFVSGNERLPARPCGQTGNRRPQSKRALSPAGLGGQSQDPRAAHAADALLARQIAKPPAIRLETCPAAVWAPAVRHGWRRRNQPGDRAVNRIFRLGRPGASGRVRGRFHGPRPLRARRHGAQGHAGLKIPQRQLRLGHGWLEDGAGVQVPCLKSYHVSHDKPAALSSGEGQINPS